jgi:hypothetical protein
MVGRAAGRPAVRAAPLPSSITYVTFASRNATTPAEHTQSWADLAGRLSRHARRPDKDGPGWSPAVYKRDEGGTLPTRANDAVQALTCAVADVDHIELDDVVALREHICGQGLACAIYSTHSSTEAAPRIRVIVPLAEPVPAETWPRLWPTLNEQLFLGLADRAASDPSRLYYLPAAPPDALVIGEHRDGLALDWHGLPLADPLPTADPVATAGTGPAQIVDPEDMPILERLFSGRRGEQRMRAWMGDYADFGGDASSADQSIANGLVAYCRGNTARAERIMRAGAWRPKWDERRGSTTWLGYTFGKALAAYRAWTGRQDATGEPEATEQAPADETPAQTIARLQHELAQARTVIATQQTVIRAERSARQEAVETVRLIGEILARPREHMTDDFKVHTIVTILEAHSRASRGVSKLPGAVLEERTGHTKNKVSDNMQDLAARDRSPIKRRLTREWVADEFGQAQPITISEVIPLHATVPESMMAVLTMGGPSSREQQRRQKDRERAESRTWGRCSTHDNDLVALKGYCPDCGEVVGERVVRRSEFDTLNPLNPGIRESASAAPAPVVVGTKGPGIRESAPAPVSLLDYAATRADEPPARCPAPGCTAMEFRRLPDGSWRCLRSSHDPRVYDLPAVAGASE